MQTRFNLMNQHTNQTSTIERETRSSKKSKAAFATQEQMLVNNESTDQK